MTFNDNFDEEEFKKNAVRFAADRQLISTFDYLHSCTDACYGDPQRPYTTWLSNEEGGSSYLENVAPGNENEIFIRKGRPIAFKHMAQAIRLSQDIDKLKSENEVIQYSDEMQSDILNGVLINKLEPLHHQFPDAPSLFRDSILDNNDSFHCLTTTVAKDGSITPQHLFESGDRLVTYKNYCNTKDPQVKKLVEDGKDVVQNFNKHRAEILKNSQAKSYYHMTDKEFQTLVSEATRRIPGLTSYSSETFDPSQYVNILYNDKTNEVVALQYDDHESKVDKAESKVYADTTALRKALDMMPDLKKKIAAQDREIGGHTL